MGKKIYIILFLLSSYNVSGQRTIFKIPDADAIPKSKLYVKPEIVFAKETQEYLTLTYGLGNSLELGININDFILSTKPHPLFGVRSKPETNPDILLNFRAAFDISSLLKTAFGVQYGLNFMSDSKVKFAEFTYLNLQRIFNYNKIVGGVFYSNSTYNGTQEQISYFLGGEVSVIDNKLYLKGDHIGGKNFRSGTILGLGLNLLKEWQLGLGIHFSHINDFPNQLIFQFSNHSLLSIK